MSSHAYAFLGTPGFVRDPERFDETQILSAMRENAGHLLFHHAASQIVDAPLIHISASDVPYLNTPEIQAAQALIIPAGAYLRLHTDWESLNNYIEGLNKPLVVLGLGAQAPGALSETEMIAALKASPSVMRMVDIFRERARFVTVYGDYTKRVCAALGLPDVEVTGCPSLLLNPDPRLGEALATRLAFAASGAPSGAPAGALPVRMSATAAAPLELIEDPEAQRLEQRLLATAKEHDGLYIQQSGHQAAFLACCGRWYDLDPDARDQIGAVLAGHVAPLDLWAFLAKSGRFPISVLQWLSDLRGQDLVIGTRMYGALAAIAVGTPGVVISQMSAKSELMRTHHLPFLDRGQALAAGSLSEAVRQVTFNPVAFDRARIFAARRFVRGFDRLNIPLAAHVRHLAGVSRPSPGAMLHRALS